MKKLIKLSILMAALVSFSASAGNIFTGAKTVTSILTNLNGSLFIVLDDMSVSPGCATRTNSYFLDANSATGAKGIYAMILSAQVSGQKVNISVDDSNCTGSGYAQVTSAKIVP